MQLTLSEKVEACLNDLHFTRVMKKSLFSSIFLKDDNQRKEYIKGLVLESILTIMTKVDFDNEAFTLYLMHRILTDIVFDEIQEVIKKLSKESQNLRCMISVEGNGIYLENEDINILKIIEEGFPKISN